MWQAGDILCHGIWVPVWIPVLTSSLSCPLLFCLLWTSYSLSVYWAHLPSYSCYEATGARMATRCHRVSPCVFLGLAGQAWHPVLPFYYPAHLIPTDSQTLASWIRMAKPPVTLVPRVTQAVAVRGKGELTGARGRRQDVPGLGV